MPGPPAATCIFWIRCLSEEQKKQKLLLQRWADSRGRETACTGVTGAYEPPPLESELSHLSLQPLKKTFIPLPSVENQLPVCVWEGLQEVKRKEGRERDRREEGRRRKKLQENETTVITGAIKAVNLSLGTADKRGRY